MPRKAPWQTKEDWYEATEGCATIASLPTTPRYNRTVQRAVEEVRQHRLAATARMDLLTEGLRRHQKELLGLVQATVNAATSLPLHLDLHYPGVLPPRVLELSGSRAFLSDGEYTDVLLIIEEQFHWQLLREHLCSDPIYRYLSGWKATRSGGAQCPAGAKQLRGRGDSGRGQARPGRGPSERG